MDILHRMQSPEEARSAQDAKRKCEASPVLHPAEAPEYRGCSLPVYAPAYYCGTKQLSCQPPLTPHTQNARDRKRGGHSFRMHSLELDMTQVCIRNVADKDPPDLEHAFPLVWRPNSTTTCIVNLKRALLFSKTIRMNELSELLTAVSISAIPQKWPLALTLKKR